MPFLFSYGDLQQERVQVSTFGRLLDGQIDELVGFEPSLVEIQDPEVVIKLGKTHHANVVFDGDVNSQVSGMVFEVTDEELVSADEFEQAFFYKRIDAALASGKHAWVYVYDPNLMV